jgi:hypothetical protein
MMYEIAKPVTAVGAYPKDSSFEDFSRVSDTKAAEASPFSIKENAGSSPRRLSWNLKRSLRRQYAGDHCRAAWLMSSEP